MQKKHLELNKNQASLTRLLRINDADTKKQPIPQGLLPKQIECITRLTATNGLNLTKHTRYNKEDYYLIKALTR